ncbi:MAG: protein-(glutamine-N5) methyltransferase, release factor-specific, partial [Brevundimonas sp.]
MSDTLLTAWKAAQGRLKAGRIDSPAIDARLLLEAATGAGRVDILTDPYRAVTPEQLATLDAMVERRLRREPVSRILGRKGFWKILLTVTPDVLSPRPDTETHHHVQRQPKPEREAYTASHQATATRATQLA